MNFINYVMWYCVDGGWVLMRFCKVLVEFYIRIYNIFWVSVVVVGCKFCMLIIGCFEDF